MPIKWEDLLAGGAGAVDEALYGIPEWLLKKVNREGVEKYIKAHEPAYRTGETIGTVGSMFLPVPGAGLVKGLGLAGKVAKGVDTATDIARLADKGSDVARLIKGADTAADVARAAKPATDWLKLAKTGAFSGAAEAGVRGVTGEKTPEQILKDITSGAAFGAGGGVLGGAIGKAMPRLTKEAAKGSELAYLGTTDMKARNAMSYLRDMAGANAKGIGKFKAADKARSELVRVGREIGAHIPGKMDDAILEHAAAWNKIDDAVEKLAPEIRASDLYSNAAGTLDLPDLYKEFGQDEVDAFLKQVLEEGTKRQGVANSRGFLSDLVEASYSPGNVKTGRDAGIQRMQRKIAQGLRSGVDDTVQTIAEKAGLDIDFKKLKRDYLPMRALAEAGAKADITPTRVNLGSPTAEKLAVSGALGLGGFASGDKDMDIKDRLARAAIGAGAGALGSRAIGSLATRGIAAASPIANLIESAVSKAAPEALERTGALVGGQAGSVISRKAIEQAAPSTPTEAEAATVGATAGQGDEPAYRGMIIDKMKAYAAAQGVPEDSEEFATFAQQVYAATDGFAPDKIANVLYTDPAERAAYMKALTASRTMAEVMPTASRQAPGLLGSETDEEKIAREAAVDQLASMVGDIAKERGSEAAAKKGLTRILAGNESPERKAELVKTLLEQYGVDLDQLTELGVS